VLAPARGLFPLPEQPTDRPVNDPGGLQRFAAEALALPDGDVDSVAPTSGSPSPT